MQVRTVIIPVLGGGLLVAKILTGENSVFEIQ
jgi:hypothetical protein